MLGRCWRQNLKMLHSNICFGCCRVQTKTPPNKERILQGMQTQCVSQRKRERERERESGEVMNGIKAIRVRKPDKNTMLSISLLTFFSF